MKVRTYEDFVGQVAHYRIYPFSTFIPEHPSLTEAASECEWHNDTEHDPWQWRIRIVKDRHAAYGKFFGGKLAFIHIDSFPYVKSVLSGGESIEEKYRSGTLSTSAYHLYAAIAEAGSIDSRRLRRAAGLDAREHKKEYEKALVELQGFGGIVISGADWDESESGWKSMCYETSDHWLESAQAEDPVAARDRLQAELLPVWRDKAYSYLAKRIKLS